MLGRLAQAPLQHTLAFMPNRPPRLDRVFQCYDPSLYFVTFNTHERQALLANAQVHAALIRFAHGGEVRGNWSRTLCGYAGSRSFVCSRELGLLTAAMGADAQACSIPHNSSRSAALAAWLFRSFDPSRRKLCAEVGVRTTESSAGRLGPSSGRMAVARRDRQTRSQIGVEAFESNVWVIQENRQTSNIQR